MYVRTYVRTYVRKRVQRTVVSCVPRLDYVYGGRNGRPARSNTPSPTRGGRIANASRIPLAQARAMSGSVLGSRERFSVSRVGPGEVLGGSGVMLGGPWRVSRGALGVFWFHFGDVSKMIPKTVYKTIRNRYTFGRFVWAVLVPFDPQKHLFCLGEFTTF